MCISQALAAAREAAVAGTTAAAELQRQVENAIAAGGGRVDYVEVGGLQQGRHTEYNYRTCVHVLALCVLACLSGNLPGALLHVASQSPPPLPSHTCRWWMHARCGQWRMCRGGRCSSQWCAVQGFPCFLDDTPWQLGVAALGGCRVS